MATATHAETQQRDPWQRGDCGVGLFMNCVIYINGSTRPHSELRIKQLIAQHGGRIALGFSRATTHCILGHGLAARKIEKEIKAKPNPYFIAAQWIVDSVAAGKRLDTAKYSALQLQKNTLPEMLHRSKLQEIASNSSSGKALATAPDTAYSLEL